MMSQETNNGRRSVWMLDLRLLDILLADGTRPELLVAMDSSTRCLLTPKHIRHSHGTKIEQLEGLIAKYSKPGEIVLDRGLGCDPSEVWRWAESHRIPIRAGSPEASTVSSLPRA